MTWPTSREESRTISCWYSADWSLSSECKKFNRRHAAAFYVPVPVTHQNSEKLQWKVFKILGNFSREIQGQWISENSRFGILGGPVYATRLLACRNSGLAAS